MRPFFALRLAPALSMLACLGVGVATAQQPDVLESYRIIPSQSTVIESGGFAGSDMEYDLSGTFDLVTGYLPDIRCERCMVPYAEFRNVDAWMIPDSPLTYVLNLDDVLNLSGLEGTWDESDDSLDFSGLESQGQPIELHIERYGQSLRLTGANNPGCCDMFQYTVDLYARQVPFADFDANGIVDPDDYAMWRAQYGQTVAPAEGADANADGVVDAADYTIWRTAYSEALAAGGTMALATVVPEPQSLVLILAGIAMAVAGLRRLDL